MTGQLFGRWSPDNAVLRALVPVGILGALFSTALVGVTPAWWLVVLVAGLSIGCAVAPESVLGTAAMVLVLAWWGISLRDGLHPEALLAAAGLLLAHVAALLASLGPATMPSGGRVLRLWAVRATLVFLASPLVWAMASMVRGRPDPAGIWISGLGVAIVAAAVASTAFVAHRSPS